MPFYGWGYRYPNFLKVLKGLFCSTVDFETQYLSVFITKNGKSEPVFAKHCRHEVLEPYSIVDCSDLIPDGDYLVKNAYFENRKPCFVRVKNGKFRDRDIFVAAAYMWWCVQSGTPTGATTLHLPVFEDPNCYSEGEGGELYHVHDGVKSVFFDTKKKSVTIETYLTGINEESR